MARCFASSCTTEGICVQSEKGRVGWSGLSHCLSQDLHSFPPSCRSPTSSTPGELRPLPLRGPAPPRVCALAKGRGSGALTPGGRGGRAEGERGLGLAGAVRGGRGEGGETVVGLLLVPEPVRPEGRGDSGRETAAAWRPGVSRPTLLFPTVAAVAAGVAGTL